MSILMKRVLVLIAALTLAGMTVGCDRTDSSLGDTPGLEGANNFDPQGITDQEQAYDPTGAPGQAANSGIQAPSEMGASNDNPAQAEQPGADPSQMAQGNTLDDQPAANENSQTQGELAGADQAGQQAQDNQDNTLSATRDKVSSTLGIPTSAVIIDSQDEQTIRDAPDEFEREARVTASTVERYLDRVDASSFDDEQQSAYQELQTSMTTLDADIDQFAMATGDQRDELKSQVEEHLSSIDDNWEKISDSIDFNQSATGGGPEEGQDNSIIQPGMDESGQQPSDQNSGEVETY